MPKPIKEKKGAKGAWVSREDRNGFSLGYATQKKTYWLTNFRFSDEPSMKRALKANVVIINLKGKK